MAFVTNNTPLSLNIRGTDIRAGETVQMDAPPESHELVAYTHVDSITVSDAYFSNFNSSADFFTR